MTHHADTPSPTTALEHQIKLLAQALGECIQSAGITRPGAELTGPELLMFADDLKRLLETQATGNGMPEGAVVKEVPKYFSEEASSTIRGMVEYCLNQRVCLGMGEGFKSFEPEVEHDFVLELRAFAQGAGQVNVTPVSSDIAGDGGLAVRMKEAGMFSIAELLSGTPMDAIRKHAAVNDMASFQQWLQMKFKEYAEMQARFILDKREDDDLYEWVLSHEGVFAEVNANFRAALSTSTPPALANGELKGELYAALDADAVLASREVIKEAARLLNIYAPGGGSAEDFCLADLRALLAAVPGSQQGEQER